MIEKDIYESISFNNNKPPGNDGLTKGFYQKFWQDVNDIFFNSLQESKGLKYLCTSQVQAVIKFKNHAKIKDMFLIHDFRDSVPVCKVDGCY